MATYENLDGALAIRTLKEGYTFVI